MLPPKPTRSSADGKYRITVPVQYRLDTYRLTMMLMSDMIFDSERKREKRLKALNSRRKIFHYARMCFFIHGCFGMDDTSERENFVVHKNGLSEDEWEARIRSHCEKYFPDLD